VSAADIGNDAVTLGEGDVVAAGVELALAAVVVLSSIHSCVCEEEGVALTLRLTVTLCVCVAADADGVTVPLGELVTV
jgi:hypothetical protein